MTRIKQIIESVEVKGVKFLLLETDEKGGQRFACLWGSPSNLEGKEGDSLLPDCISLGEAKEHIQFNPYKGSDRVNGKIILNTLHSCKKRFDAMVRNAEFVNFEKVHRDFSNGCTRFSPL